MKRRDFLVTSGRVVAGVSVTAFGGAVLASIAHHKNYKYVGMKDWFGGAFVPDQIYQTGDFLKGSDGVNIVQIYQDGHRLVLTREADGMGLKVSIQVTDLEDHKNFVVVP